MRSLLCLLLIVASPAWAWRECLDDSRTPEHRYSCLATYEIEQIGNQEFELGLAYAASAAGEYAHASIVLARVVRRNPADAGLRLDLTIISLRAGDENGARSQLDYLRNIPDPPPTVASIISQLTAQLEARSPAAAVSNGPRYSLRLGLGYDDNPNLGVQDETISLLIDGVERELTPDQSLAPDSEPFVGLGLYADQQRFLGGYLRGGLDLRQHEGKTDEDSASLSMQYDRQLGNRRLLQAAASGYRTRDGFGLVRLGFGARQLLGDCNCFSSGLSLQLIEGTERVFRAARAKIDIETVREAPVGSVRAWGSLAYHHQPRAFWGDSVSVGAGLSASRPVAGGRLSAGYSHYQSWDDNIYSPLFGRSKRDLVRNQLNVSYSRAINPSLAFYMGSTYINQSSEVPLYDYQRYLVEVGLRMSL